ncbi:MAG: bifunctional diaminohydroxyphosphoribosylaminopyrimidine deaminase/5-amino-6-(5-phosphoribosylamino)uracil reductase RibD [Bacteroidetes bacterium]|nr:bifunctional diaminohydroxyphosphoribosylaminopyrimidine deaminase/5-amino-6-(5-phosphoribosylamino)uracil reductase RibD [Bacteroidota bacterium]
MPLHYMHRCLDLALNGQGSVSPNPLVGSVIVLDDKIIGEGYHHKYGAPHAEVNAINSVENKEWLKRASLFVNLEPCSHQGKTPPCTDLIIEKGIPRVFIGNTDPFPAVNGSGIQKLRLAGVEVITGLLEKEGWILNRRFFTFHKEKRPYIILKWAQTLDGFMDIDRSDPNIPFEWISNNSLKRLVHKWRSEEDGILVGTTTAQHDDPQLTIREWYGRNPMRMVLDENLSLPESHHLFDQSTPTLVFTAKKSENKPNLEFITLNFSKSVLSQVNKILYSRGTQSLIVEGGHEMLESYLEAGCWDEARVLEGNKFFRRGLKGPDFHGEMFSSEMIGSDRLLVFRNPEKFPKDT